MIALMLVLFSVRYPPFTDKKMGVLSWLLTKNPKSNKVLMTFVPIVILGVLLGIVIKVLACPVTA